MRTDAGYSKLCVSTDTSLCVALAWPFLGADWWFVGTPFCDTCRADGSFVGCPWGLRRNLLICSWLALFAATFTYRSTVTAIEDVSYVSSPYIPRSLLHDQRVGNHEAVPVDCASAFLSDCMSVLDAIRTIRLWLRLASG